MKKLLLFLFLISNIVLTSAADHIGIDNIDFYEPNVSNAYQGKLFYDSNKEDYPIAKMKQFCDLYTGVDTAQTRCQKHNQTSIFICEYKCSLHWSVLNAE